MRQVAAPCRRRARTGHFHAVRQTRWFEEHGDRELTRTGAAATQRLLTLTQLEFVAEISLVEKRGQDEPNQEPAAETRSYQGRDNESRAR